MRRPPLGTSFATILCLLLAAALPQAQGQSTATIPPPQRVSTTGTQMQDVTGAYGVTVDARTLIIDGTAHVARDSLDAAGVQTLGKVSKAFGYTGIAASAAAGLYRAGEQYVAGDCEGAGKTAARTASAAASDLAVMTACGAMGPPGIVLGAGYAIARQTEWGTNAMNAVGDEVYYSAKGIFGEGPKLAPFDLDQPTSPVPTEFRLNQDPFGSRVPPGYDPASLRNSFHAAQARNTVAAQQRAQEEADAHTQATADAAASAAQAQAMSDLMAQSANLGKAIAAARTPIPTSMKTKSSDSGGAACAAPRTFPTKDGCHPGHDESMHPRGCHC